MLTSSLLVYDGDCGFCTRSAEWLSDHGRLPISSWQALDDLAAWGLTPAMVEEAAQWLRWDQEPLSGAEAIAHALMERGPWPVRLLGRIIASRLVAPVAAGVYGFVATHRHRMPGGSPACRIDQRPGA